VLVRGRRTDADPLRVVVWRADSGSSATLDVESLDGMVDLVSSVLEEVGAVAASRLRGFTYGQRCCAATLAEAKAVTMRGRIAIVPLAFTRSAVQEIERHVRGEVLSFALAEPPGRCVVSGRPVRTVAHVSARA
jgi:hypothetical protein